MNNFDIFDENFIKFCAEHNFVLKKRPTAAKEDFMVLTGKNGVGKSRLLQLIREYIVTIKNENYPYMIVRRLNYGEQDDEYDPDKTDHPLVTQNVLQSLNCNYQTWEKAIKILITPEKKNASMLIEHYKIYFKYYSTKSKNGTDIDRNRIKNITNPLKKYYEKNIYFEEFQKYFRRQMLKKICFGSLKQMLMLDMRYQFELDEINDKINEYKKYGLDFPYEIKKISKGFVDKSDVNERIIFTHIYEKKNVTFRDLSPGERLILHLILLIKDRENIKMENIDENIKQILLLDEPDSHCEANLVRIFIDIIDKELVNKMKIQVIMTTHNYLTICKIKEESLFVISKNGKELEIENDAGKCKSFDILAKNLIELFDITNQSVEVRASTYKGICEACKNGSLYGVL
ncbi:AAA family ATPase [Brachionus plicatilis]|uniref:AAA family ATPase n=1 Tax=Brachionus plicatilis TaxID=10195 RepID=A0A3M7RVT2_BRAPC|nr:AAA family ATPase [Brachionus plicatilis]